jgi:hypothetical protein
MWDRRSSRGYLDVSSSLIQSYSFSTHDVRVFSTSMLGSEQYEARAGRVIDGGKGTLESTDAAKPDAATKNSSTNISSSTNSYHNVLCPVRVGVCGSTNSDNLLAVATVAGGILTPCPRQTAFSIDYPFRTLSYNAVKVIDAVWNLAVGRGVQVFAAWISYKIFGMAMLRITQENQVSLELYSAIAFYPLEIKTILMVL